MYTCKVSKHVKTQNKTGRVYNHPVKSCSRPWENINTVITKNNECHMCSNIFRSLSSLDHYNSLATRRLEAEYRINLSMINIS